MVYIFHCILPKDRALQCIGASLREISAVEEDSDDEIKLITEDGLAKYLHLRQVSILMNFSYSNRLLFLHENDLRSLIVDGIGVASDHPSRSRYIDLLESGRINENISLRYIGNIQGVDVGYGVFSESHLDSGVFIGEYTGVIMSSALCSSHAYSVSYPGGEGGLEINASETGNLMRFINHSESPNCEFIHFFYDGLCHVICVSKRHEHFNK